ncbi:MAG TPA: inositol monophosphatase family protein [Acidobacteriota bacterium]|nr:inositol monophosphatase family protein [Acidobacteriota bacterium]
MSRRESPLAWTRYALKLAGEAVSRVDRISQKSGAEVVEMRDGAPRSYRHWDTETLRIDKEVEGYYIDQLAKDGIDAVMLSEEAGRMTIEPKNSPQAARGIPVFFVSDPFDGSMLYKRNIPAFWYTALAIYTRPETITAAEPLTAVVVDLVSKLVQYCDTQASYEGTIKLNGSVTGRRLLRPNTTSELAQAFLETYMMKPPFMYPTSEIFKFLFTKVKFLLPNGGPCGFCDVANGRIDIYLGHKQPHNDIYPGLAVAEKAGCIVTTFEGHPVRFDDHIEKRYNVLCTCTEALQEKVLRLLAENGINDRVGLDED